MAVTIRIAHVITWTFLFIVANCERVSNKTYVDITGVSACFRRFNATHQVGCNSEASGNVGVVYYVESDEDIKYIINVANQPPYAILMGPTLFTLTNVQNLWNSGKINGMMVIHLDSSPIPDSFSPDTTCPNDPYGLYSGNKVYGSCKQGDWNTYGNSMMFQDYAFPIFVMKNETEVNYLIHDCFEKFNKPVKGQPRAYPLCAVELKDSMSGSKDSITCIRRNNMQASLDPETYCDPLGDNNIVAPLKAVPSTEDYPDNSVIVAAARMDTFSMFENEYPGADSHVTGIVGLLAAAEAVGQVKDRITNSSKDILFAFFQGEAFDYIGSSRIVYDMENAKFPAEPKAGETHVHPINLKHISHFVEVNQLGLRDDGKLWIHTDPISVNGSTKISDEVNLMIKNITDIARQLDLDLGETDVTKPLPPSSVQSFLKKKAIPAFVLTDHQTTYTNKYYNSRFDNASTIQANTSDYDTVSVQAKMLTKVATTLARSLVLMSTGENATDVEANEKTVTHLLYCFLVNKSCDLFQEIIEEDDLATLLESSTPYPFYVGVTNTNNHVTSLTKRLLSLYIGDRQGADIVKDKCNVQGNYKVYDYTWMQGPVKDGEKKREGFCMRSTVSLTTAKSPAFDITDYDWHSGEYSTWTESSWKQNAISIRVFLIPSEQMQTIILSSGVILILLFLLLGYFINARAGIIFSTRPSRYFSY